MDRERMTRAFQVLNERIKAAEEYLKKECPAEVVHAGMHWSPASKRIRHVERDKPIAELPVAERFTCAKELSAFVSVADKRAEQLCLEIEAAFGIAHNARAALAAGKGEQNGN